jgi:hypothetical protein
MKAWHFLQVSSEIIGKHRHRPVVTGMTTSTHRVTSTGDPGDIAIPQAGASLRGTETENDRLVRAFERISARHGLGFSLADSGVVGATLVSPHSFSHQHKEQRHR